MRKLILVLDSGEGPSILIGLHEFRGRETLLRDLAVKPKVVLYEGDTQWHGFEQMEDNPNPEDNHKFVGVITTPRLMVAYRKAIQESHRDGER